jgi:hypothetical protein
MKNARQIPNCYKRFWPVSLPICAIGLLLLMLVSPLVLAKPNCDKDPVHPSCNGDGDGGAPIPYSAVLIIHEDEHYPITSPLYAPDPDGDCVAQAHTQTNISILLPRESCPELVTSESTIIQPLAFDVPRDNKSGAIVGVSLFGTAIVDGEVLAHVSEERVFETPLDVELLEEGIFIVHLHADNLELWRCDSARIKGNTVCDQYVGTFAVDDVVYFPTP